MNFEDFHLNRVILELRYDEGFLYWDNCGATNLAIRNQFPNWIWKRTDTELSIFKDIRRRIELVFNIHHIRFVQDQVDNLSQFKKAAKQITPIILEKLKIDSFNRVGNRFLCVMPLENIDEGLEILRKNKLIEIPEEKLKLFGENPNKTNFVLYIKDGDFQYRTEITTIERVEKGGIGKIDEKYFPKCGLRFDMDFAQTNKVEASNFISDEFIQRNYKFLENNLIKLIR